MDRVDMGKRHTAAAGILRRVLWILPALAGFAIQRLVAGQPGFADRYLARGVFRVVSAPIAWITSLVPVSLTEALVVLALPLLLVLIFRFVRKLRGLERHERRPVVGRAFRRLLWTVSIVYLAFMVLHGWNYARLPLSESLPLPVTARSADELAAATGWLAVKASEERARVGEDEAGVMRLSDGVKNALLFAGSAYDSVEAEYPLLDGARVRPKGVLLSHYWSYTGITGMYFPLFVEANVNIDVPQDSLPDTILHEIAHTRGFAREDEAGFLAFLAGIRSSSADFRYSAYLEAFISLSNQLYTYDADAWAACWTSVSDGIRRDLAARGAYWKGFEGPVQEASTQVNNAYLEANLQKDGVYSYGRKADLILAYLYTAEPGPDVLAKGTT